MKQVAIVCSQCEEILGVMRKADITHEDRHIYRESCECSQGHKNSIILVVEGEEEATPALPEVEGEPAPAPVAPSLWTRIKNFFLGV